MKLPENLFSKEELEEIKNAKIIIDFEKEYNDEEISDMELALKDACLDYGFIKGKPTEKCEMWERICDHFIEITDKLYA